jgi:DNA repair exonuclease SbcCD nuclease subunit
MFDYARQNEIDLILFCGDFFHTPSRVATEVLSEAARIKEGLLADLCLIALTGNHDIKMGTLNSLEVMNSPCFRVLHKETHFTIDGLHISALPYTENVKVLNQFFAAVETRKVPVFVLLHQGVSNVELNSKGFTLNELLKPEMIPSNVVQAFSGHYHSFKQVSDKLTIPGSLMQHTWADKGETRGFLDVTWDGGDLHMQRIDTADLSAIRGRSEVALKFIELTIDQLNSLHPTELGNLIHGNIIRIVSNGSVLESYREMLYRMGPASLEFIYDEQSNGEHIATTSSFKSMTDLFEEYIVRHKLDAELVSVGRQIINS